ncbi:MAG: MFS transporter [Acidobacteriota bacterium]|nr:MFS transporter [Acidobacteriota bacterium]
MTRLTDRRTRRAPGSGSTRALLVVVCLAQFMVILDVSIVNVAMPTIGRGLSFAPEDLQWVINAYTILFAGFLMLGGRCADLLGRRRVFLAGTALFSLCSLGCSLADSQALLLVARGLQGFAGALVSPATLSIITSSLREGPERNRGVGLWGAMGGLGGSSGVLLGGVLTQAFGWQAIFAVNVPIGIGVVLTGMRVLPRMSPAGGERHFDATGAVLITASLIGFTYGLVRSDALGWGSAGVIAPLAAAAGLFLAFLLVEARVARSPLVPLGVLRLGRLRAANAVVALLYAAVFPLWFFLTLYLQQVLGMSALQAGLAFLPMTLSIFAASTFAPRLVAAVGARGLISTGLVLSGIGIALLSGVQPGGSYAGSVLPGALLASIGMGCALVPATIVAMQGLPGRLSGLGSGVLNTSRLMGGAVGLALLSTIATAQTQGERGVNAARALTDGFDLAFVVAAGLCAAGAALAVALLGRRPTAGGAETAKAGLAHEAAHGAGELAESAAA